MTGTTSRRIRPVRIAVNDAIVTRTADGTIHMRSTQVLGPYPVRLTDALDE